MNYKANSFNDVAVSLPILRHKTGTILPVVAFQIGNCSSLVLSNRELRILLRIPNSAKSKAQDLVYPISHPGCMELRRSVRQPNSKVDELGEFYD